MATYSPPTTPQIDPDIREDFLRNLDQEIQATQVRHDEAQRRLQHERRHATTHDPFDEQFENADEISHQSSAVSSTGLFIQFDWYCTTPASKMEAS